MLNNALGALIKQNILETFLEIMYSMVSKCKKLSYYYWFCLLFTSLFSMILIIILEKSKGEVIIFYLFIFCVLTINQKKEVIESNTELTQLVRETNPLQRY
jgi:hypothetical protein